MQRPDSPPHAFLPDIAHARWLPVVLVVALSALWLSVGLVGHDPWKPDEAYTFGIVRDFLRSGDWIVPHLAREPFMEKPPLFFIVAGGFAEAFGHALPLHDAARLASGFFTAITLTFLVLTGRELYGRGFGALPVLILIGCVGPVARLHQMVTDVALVAGIATGLYGLALARRFALGGGIALGAGAAISFLSKGLLGPGWLALTALLLPFFDAWRKPRYAHALAIAAIVAALPMIGWMLMLYERSPDLFHRWFVDNNFGRFLGFVRLGTRNPPLFYAEVLPWFTFPAFPLAGWTLWCAWREGARPFAEPGIALPLTSCAVILLVLGIASDSRNLYVMPIIVPLSLLAAACIDRLPAWGSGALSALARWGLGFVAATLWLAWIALVTGVSADLQAWLLSFNPGYVPRFRWGTFIMATVATIFAVAILRRPLTSPREGVLKWAAAATLCWALIGSLWAPFLNAGKSYRTMLASLAQSLPASGCIASMHLGEPQRALLDYFGGVVTRRVEVDPVAIDACDWLLVQGWRASGANAPATGWGPVWEGARPGDITELYRLFRRGTEGGHVVRFPS
jgi:4-amino-4-deoxy-L-arabinose transferase-like glycosyltransferase